MGFSEFKSRMRDKAEDLRSDMAQLKVQAGYMVNPNHRHDEEHEKERDAALQAIRDSHRFNSFARERGVQPESGCDVKWYSDGLSYFWALGEALESAKESIMILDWWLSPELYLRRPPAEHEDYRLDRVLKRKAEQGVKIYIIVYKEVTQSMSMSSSHTKHHLEDMHENIAVMRHPDHLGGEVTMLWSHHEKLVLVDNVIACVGGLDACFGRWDTHNFPLSDAHPSDMDGRMLFPGQDYNDARLADFVKVEKWLDNQQSRLEVPRMPWHDVHTMLVGKVVLDLAQHYCERWNFVRALKYKHNHRYHFLSFPHVLRQDGEQDEEDDAILKHPDYATFKDGVRYMFHRREPRDGGHDPHGGDRRKGNMRVQAIRSSADWSHGILTEDSIQRAYCQMIQESSHCIYIENQFFCSAAEPGGNSILKNRIAESIAQRALSAAREGKPWRAIIIIPAIPGFAGDVKSSGGTLAIMEATYKTICRGPKSIMGLIAAEGFDPHHYVQVFHLRSFDRMQSPALIRDMEAKSGVKYDECQAALARMYLGDDADENSRRLNSEISITMATEGESLKVEDTKKGEVRKLPLPPSVAEAKAIVDRFEAAAPPEGREINDSIRHRVFAGQGSLMDEKFYGSPDDERNAFVQEELYIHCKLLIVDDRRVLCGSANINDRSQMGYNDSEIAVVIEDMDQIETTMNGQKYRAAPFAASFRRFLMRLHLGLIEPQPCPGPVTNAMGIVGVPSDYDFGSAQDQLVADPLSADLDRLINETARTNAEAFESVFHTVPSDQVRDWASYDKWMPKPPIKAGHVAAVDMDANTVKQTLSRVRGSIVPLAKEFLVDVPTLTALSAAVNPATLPIYL